MEIIQNNISFDQILQEFDIQHPISSDNSNNWARRNIIAANDKFQGEWRLVELNHAEALGILLPYHIGEDQSKLDSHTLVPIAGLTVHEATERLKTLNDYSKAKPKCWESIDYHRFKNFSKIHLSSAPSNFDDYNSLNWDGTSLVHLDGLHRLIAWNLDRRFEENKYYSELTAYLAG